jgi:hypothetical protein
MAVTIDASPEQVWPWLVQLGWNRGGWYSWDLLDNGGRPSATEVHPEWQDVAMGDLLKFRALGRDIDAYKVGVIEPNKYLGLYGCTTLGGRWLDPEEPRPSSYMEATWGFQLNEHSGGRTRLVISGYQTFPPPVGGTFHCLVAAHCGFVAHAGADVVGSQAKHRISWHDNTVEAWFQKGGVAAALGTTYPAAESPQSRCSGTVASVARIAWMTSARHVSSKERGEG